jgi:hypothetical protein
MNADLSRQIKDIQIQIKNLSEDFGAYELHAIFSVSAEIKKLVLETTADNFVLEHINEIPDYKMNDFKIGFDFIGFLVGIFSGRFDSFNEKKFDFGKAKLALDEISTKYATLEQKLKN